MDIGRLADQQLKVIETAIGKYYESPAVCKLAVDFAESQGEFLQNYNPRERLFILTDGEPYTAEYIIKHMEKQPAE